MMQSTWSRMHPVDAPTPVMHPVNNAQNLSCLGLCVRQHVLTGPIKNQRQPPAYQQLFTCVDVRCNCYVCDVMCDADAVMCAPLSVMWCYVVCNVVSNVGNGTGAASYCMSPWLPDKLTVVAFTGVAMWPTFYSQASLPLNDAWEVCFRGPREAWPRPQRGKGCMAVSLCSLFSPLLSHHVTLLARHAAMATDLRSNEDACLHGNRTISEGGKWG